MRASFLGYLACRSSVRFPGKCSGVSDQMQRFCLSRCRARCHSLLRPGLLQGRSSCPPPQLTPGVRAHLYSLSHQVMHSIDQRRRCSTSGWSGTTRLSVRCVPKHVDHCPTTLSRSSMSTRLHRRGSPYIGVVGSECRLGTNLPVGRRRPFERTRTRVEQPSHRSQPRLACANAGS